jgi:16S rRNA (cytidine1402-2'-O)-methyltransferase
MRIKAQDPLGSIDLKVPAGLKKSEGLGSSATEPEASSLRPELDPGLYLVASPIGHLGDLSRRAGEVLAGSDLVAAEDTRRSLKLLNHLKAKKPLISYREQNHAKAWPRIERVLAQKGRVAFLSDAGAPGVSDPGASLVQAARGAGYAIWPIPGPSAVITALMASGFWAERFVFGGFLPEKSAERLALLEKLDSLGLCLAFFEAPHRLLASLADLAKALGPRPALLAREMTKAHEEYLFGPLTELVEKVKEAPRKGEITLVLGPKDKALKDAPDWDKALAAIAQDTRPVGVVAAELAGFLGQPKKEAYARLLKFRGENEPFAGASPGPSSETSPKPSSKPSPGFKAPASDS